MLRWIAVIGQAIAVLFVYFGLHLTLPLGACLALISASAWFNIFLATGIGGKRLASIYGLFAQLFFDLVQLAWLLGLTGGVSNPFLILLGVPVIVAVTVLPARSALLLALMTLLAMLALVFWAQPLPWYAGVRPQIPTLYVIGLATAFVVTTGFAAISIWRISEEGKNMHRALAATEAVLARESRLSALGSLAAATAHELGTPLGTIQIIAKEMTRELPKDSPSMEDAHLLLEQASRCRQILSQLSAGNAEKDPVFARQPLSALLDEIAAPLMASGKSINVSVAAKSGAGDTPEPVIKRRSEITHGLGAFSENAVDFAASRVDLRALWDDNWIEILICDDGQGIAENIMEKLGEPYVTSRRGGDASGHGGLGLGFFIAKTLIERTQGMVKVGHSAQLGGAMIRVIWSRAAIEDTLPV